jgi:Inositol monophosphatase family
MDARQGRVTQPSTYLPIAAQAVDLATQIVRERLPSVVDTKGDRDMVSDIDLEIERNVRRFLHKQSPEVAFVGEEEGNGVGGGALQWVLDPVDGTANFVKGIPLYRSRWRSQREASRCSGSSTSRRLDADTQLPRGAGLTAATRRFGCGQRLG